VKSGPVNFETELKGMSVLDIATGEKIGSVSDIIINPTEGKVLGLAIIRSDKEVRAVSADQGDMRPALNGKRDVRDGTHRILAFHRAIGK